MCESIWLLYSKYHKRANTIKVFAFCYLLCGTNVITEPVFFSNGNLYDQYDI